MIIVMRHDATPAQVADIVQQIEQHGMKSHLSSGEERTVIGVIGTNPFQLKDLFVEAPGVAEVIPITKPYKLSNREFRPHDTHIRVGGVDVGSDQVWIVAGPCSIENAEMFLESARGVKAAGGHALRGGAFKPRTSPYSFQGLRHDGLSILKAVRAETGLPIVSEVLSEADLDAVADVADVIQIGARNMQNFSLLSAEYILSQGNYDVILCERGIRTFEPYTRNTLDLNAVPLIRELSHLPVIVDPSHGTGRRSLVIAMALAAVAAGAHGVIVEVHPHPEVALSDGAQSLTLEGFRTLIQQLRPVAEAVGRQLE
ncbi:MAG TPA: 3-deoxy-7-phosphoheptulonate synthase [Candidatus Limnocylindria bacterium]|nr:3-deoxy-7-phosphoheptulonate synthase [Candidatus Limnocylindria bacterium]